MNLIDRYIKTLEYSSEKDDGFVFDDFVADLNKELIKMNSTGAWYAEGKNIGWQKQNVHMDFLADSAYKLLQHILPRNTQCLIKIKIDPSQILATVYHHDSPMGDSFVIIPIY
jgi:hypothetical protein